MQEKFRHTAVQKEHLPVDPEDEAEAELEFLLADPENQFLSEVPQNREYIENAESSREALRFAQERIAQRAERTSSLRMITSVEGVQPIEVSYVGVANAVRIILENAFEIGQGDDGRVVVDRNEFQNFPQEICYKFEHEARTPRDRNPMEREIELQGEFYEVVSKIPEGRIGVPTPFYYLSVGGRKVIAMEKLDAASAEDILRGRGHLPSWFDVDEFCEELEKTLAQLHANHLFHRDLHLGNIMISQTATRSEKDGFIIDFGLSTRTYDPDPYVKTTEDNSFTYKKDDGIIERLKLKLKGLQGAWA